MRRSTCNEATAPNTAPAGPGRAWRLLGTAVSFSLFGLGGLVLSLLIMPPIWLFVHPAERRKRAGRWLVSKAFAGFVWAMNGFGVLRYRISGDMHAADNGGCLIVANHPSLIDVVFLLAIFQRADCVVKYAHWTNPFMMGVIRTAGFISNKEPDLLMSTCIERLKAGATIVVFPEGTRSVPGKPLKLPRGAATIAVRAGARVLPIQLRCTPTTLTKAERWYHIPERQVLFEVNILAPLESASFLAEAASERQACLALNEALTGVLNTPLEIAGGSVKL